MDMRIDLYHHVDIVAIKQIADSITILTQKADSIMLTQSQLAATLTELGVQLRKVAAETTTLLEKVAALTQAVADAGSTTPEVDAALADVQAQAQVVDDLVPDAPTP